MPIRQLTELGIDRHAIARHVAAGQLHRTYRGVYAVGRPDLTPDGHRLAAVLALGATAVLSHMSAAGLWDLVGGALHPVHVTLPGSGRAQRRCTIRVHRTATLHPEDVLHLNAIPVTSVDRTLLDLASVVTRPRLLRAVEQAEHLRRLDVAGVRRVLARNPHVRGAGVLAGVLESYAGAPAVRSELEDRVRDATLQRAGLRVLRVTDERLTRDPAAVVDDIRALARLA